MSSAVAIVLLTFESRNTIFEDLSRERLSDEWESSIYESTASVSVPGRWSITKVCLSSSIIIDSRDTMLILSASVEELDFREIKTR